MYKQSKVTVILPTYNEKDSIRQVIQEFEALGVVDEIVVVSNDEICAAIKDIFEDRRLILERIGSGHTF